MFFFVSGRHYAVRYSIYSGDPNGYFRIDPNTGSIRTASNLDHEARASVLLNIQATSGHPPAYGHTQVQIYQPCNLYFVKWFIIPITHVFALCG